MAAKNSLSIFMLFFLIIFSVGMARAPEKSLNQETKAIFLQVIAEDVLGDIEYAYASKDLNGLLDFLDKGFDGRPRFEHVLESYFSSINKPFVHFAIDMVIADKNGINVKVHWQRRGVTSSDIVIKSQGKAQFLFKRYPEGLKLKRILQKNPFF